MAYFDEDDYSADTRTSGSIAIGATASGKINYAFDVDWIKTTLLAGTTYVFGISEPGEMVLTLGNGSALLAGAIGQRYDGPAFEYTPAASGDYYLGVSYGYQQYNASYTVSAAVKPADAVPGNITTTAVLEAGATVHGSMEVGGDSDWYKFHAEPGQHYLFGWSGHDSVITSLAILDSKGRPTNSYLLEAAEAGDYYIAVSGNRAGEYDLTSFVRSDDYSANDSAPGQLHSGGQLAGAVEYASDTDRIYIELEAGSAYTLTLSGDASSSYGLQFELFGPDGQWLNRIGEGDYTGQPRQLAFTAQTSGRYAIDVSDWHASTSQHHGYILSASSGVPDDYGDTAASATAVALDTPVHGLSAHAGDVDMFRLTLQAGVSYQLQLAPDPAHDSGGSSAARMNISGADGATTLAAGYNTVAFTPAADGSYYVAVSSSTPAYYLFNATTAQDDWRANADGAGRLALNGSASGTLESGADRDWFALDMTAGQTYGVALKYGPGVTLSPAFSQVTIRFVDAEGHTLASATPNTLSNEATLSYTAAASSRYYVEIGGSTGAYLLGASLVQRDDVGNTPAGAAVLSAGAAVNGALEVASDIDYYRLAVSAGETYAIRLKDSVRTDWWRPELEVTDSHGAYVRSIYTVSDEYTLVTASSSGDIYIKIDGQDGAPPIAYQLGATALGADDYGNRASDAGALDVGGTVRGVINYADDADWFKVTLEAGATYQFTLRGAAGGNGTLAANKAALLLYDGQSRAMAAQGFSSYLGGDFTLGYTAAASGDYYVQVRPDNMRDAAAGSYLLTAAAIPARPQLLHPASGEAGLHNITDSIVLTFNEAVRIADYSKMHLLDEAGNSYFLSLHQLSNVFSSTVVIPVPTVHFKPGAVYRLVVDDGALLNAAGATVDGLKNYTIAMAPFAAVGTDGADVLPGLHNGAVLNGGAGIDTVLYNDSETFYQISRNGAQTVVSHWLGATTSDTLVDVERLLFDHSAIALDIDGHGGQAYRLYQAAFGRTPDKAGLGFWIKALDQGSSLAQVAGEFVNSSEFLARSGGAASDDATFLTLLYNNVLQRAPDSGGLQYWNDALHHGASRAEVLMAFSESAENQAALIGVIGNGFAYTPYGG